MSFISNKEFKRIVAIFVILFLLLLVGVRIDTDTENVKYVMKSPDSLVQEQLQIYLANQEYHFFITDKNFEIFPLKRNDQEFSRQLAYFKEEFIDISLIINLLWLKSRKLNGKASGKVECGDPVKCSITNALNISQEEGYDRIYQIAFNKLKNKKGFGNLVNSNWTSWAMIDRQNLDTSFQVVIIRPNYTIYKKILLAFWVSLTLSVLIILIRSKREL